MAQWNSANNHLQTHNKTLFEVSMNNSRSLYAADWTMQVAMGKVPGATLLNLYGYQATVDGTWIPVWENATTYTYPPDAGTTMLLYSASASDTNVTVFIDGLDVNYNIQTETLVLTNGTTGVTTTKSYRRINNMRVTGSVNPVGILRLSSADKVTTYAQINVGVGKTQWSIYTVPAGYTFYLNRVTASASATSAAKVLGYRVYQQFNGLTSLLLQSPWIDTYETQRVVPNPYAERTSIQWQVTSDTTSQVGVRVEGVLVNNTILAE
jgi:hypothetical protein